MTRKQKKEEEKAILREFLKTVGFKAESVKPGERPDFKATIYDNMAHISVGIEMTEYLPPKQSSLGRNRQAVRKALFEQIQNLLPQYPNLRNVDGTITFVDEIPKKRILERLAQEILVFASENLEQLLVPRSYARAILSKKDKFPLVWKYIRLRLKPAPHSASLLCWMSLLVEAAFTAVNPEKLISIIEGKARKLRKYSKEDTAEMWLIIHGGYSMHSAFTDVERGVTPQVIASLKQSDFQRVYMWERFERRAYEIWPHKKEIAVVEGRSV